MLSLLGRLSTQEISVKILATSVSLTHYQKLVIMLTANLDEAVEYVSSIHTNQQEMIPSKNQVFGCVDPGISKI